MKKLATKSDVKSAIKALVEDTASKVIKLARSNGFEIVTYHNWNVVTKTDLKDYSNGEQILKDTTSFAKDDLDSFGDIVNDIYYRRLEVASTADITKFVKSFNAKKAAYDKEQNSANAEKIAQLKKRIAKAQAELNSLTTR